VQEAGAWLDGKGVEFDARHIKEQNPSYKEQKR